MKPKKYEKSEFLKKARLEIAREKAALAGSPKATQLAEKLKELGKDTDLVVEFRIKDVAGPVMAKCNCICFA